MAKKRVGIRNGALFNQTSTLWNNLLAYYTGDGTPDDSLGNYNGTLVNGTTYGTGKINQGFSFDGVNDYVDCDSISEINSSSTVSYSYWGKKTASNKHLLVGSQTSITNGFWLSWWSDGNVYCSARNGNYSYTSYALPFDTNWHHFVGVYNGTSVKIYIDGVLQATNTTGVPATLSSTSGNDFNIGYLESKYTDGNIDEVGVWNRELTASEVTELYNSGNGKQYTPQVVNTPSIITDGLVLNLDAGNTSSYPGTGTDWFDLTSNDNDGVLVNGPTYLTDNGGVISFDGVNDYVDFNNEFNVVNNVTVCAWVKSDNTTQTTIIGKYEYSTNNRSWYMGTYTNGSSLQVILSSNGSTFNRYLGGNISDGQWHHVSFSFSSGDVKLYIDSVEQSITQIGTNIINSLHSFSGGIEVGSVSGGVGNFFNGEISNTKVYSKVLTNNEIQQNYNSTKSRFGL